MKKLLGIVVLGLLLTFNVSAEKVAKTLNQSVHFCDNRSTGDSQGSSRLNNYQISFSKNCKANKGSSKITEKEFIIGMLDLKKNTKQDKFLNRRIDNLFSYYEASNLNTNKIQNTLYEFNIQSSLVKKEPTITTKKKTMVAKEEQSQTQKVAQKEKLKVISGYTTDGNYFEFHMQKQKVKELVKIHGYFDYKQVMDNYYMTEFSKREVVANDSYTNFANRLGKTYGGERKFYKRYKKEISESKKNCSCEDPIYKTFLLDLETGHAYKVYHPQSNKPKLSGDFRLKKNIGKKALLKVGDIIYDIENAVGMDTIELLVNGYMIYSAIENPQGVFKKSKGSSSTSSGSTVTKSLGSGSGSGSVLDREFGGQSLKRLIAISRR